MEFLRSLEIAGATAVIPLIKTNDGGLYPHQAIKTLPARAYEQQQVSGSGSRK
jgi:hypothetical protein